MLNFNSRGRPALLVPSPSGVVFLARIKRGDIVFFDLGLMALGLNCRDRTYPIAGTTFASFEILSLNGKILCPVLTAPRKFLAVSALIQK